MYLNELFVTVAVRVIQMIGNLIETQCPFLDFGQSIPQNAAAVADVRRHI